MSIGGSPATPGSVPLNQNDVEIAKWKSSANASPQDITIIELNGTTIWTKPSFSMSGSASWNRNNNKVTINATVGANATSWTYQIGTGSQVTGSGTSVQVSDTSNGTKTVTLRSFKNSTEKSSTTVDYTVAVPSIAHTLTGGEEQLTINITTSNHISSDKWQYKIDSGEWQTGAGISTTSKTVTGVVAGTRSVQVRLQNSGDTVLATSGAVSVSVASATPIATIPSNHGISFSREIRSNPAPLKTKPLNRGTEHRRTSLVTFALPKPEGFTAGTGSVGVEVDFIHVGDSTTHGQLFHYAGSVMTDTRTFTNNLLDRSYVGTATSNIAGVPSVFSNGRRWYKPKFGEGYYIDDVANAQLTITHPYNMIYYATSGSYSSGRTTHSAIGDVLIMPFYDYDNDTPALAYIMEGAFSMGHSQWASQYLRASSYNFASPNACWLGRTVTLHPGGNDPHWNHHQYGVTQRNPGGYAS
jgi:hypothetical protein